jgi:hypothetical protein
VPLASATEPEPLPAKETESVGLKRAVRFCAPLIRTLHVGTAASQEPRPPQPAKAIVEEGISVSVTVEPAGKDAEQVVLELPQLMPVAGLELKMMEGLIGPAVLRVRVKFVAVARIASRARTKMARSDFFIGFL